MVNIPMMDVFQPSFWCRISQPATVWFGKFGDGAIALLTSMMVITLWQTNIAVENHIF